MKNVYACRVIVTKSYECTITASGSNKSEALEKANDFFRLNEQQLETRYVNHGRQYEIYAADAHEISPGGQVDVEA